MGDRCVGYKFYGLKLTPWSDMDLGAIDCIAVVAMCGSFNPIHQTHLDMYGVACDAIMRRTPRVLLAGGFLSPVNDLYGKEGLNQFKKRAEICKAAVSGHPSLSLDEWEGRQSHYVRTVFVLEHLQQEVQRWYEVKAEPSVEQLQWVQRNPIRVLFLCGGDLFASFLQPGCWSVPLLKRLLDQFDIFVVRRPGTPGCQALLEKCGSVIEGRDEESGDIVHLDLSTYHYNETETLCSTISSTDIRACLLRDPMSDISSVVPSGAESLIRYYYGGLATLVTPMPG
ncbi:nicotinamide mononucleotide adenylyltransferase [Trypanosoma vivax]|nr:nicotinamide mononucleotide adenylyltransferase [Trypanosoma vivax]